MSGCVLSQLRPSGSPFCEKGLGLRPRTFFTAKNVELLGLYPIRKSCVSVFWWPVYAEINNFMKNVRTALFK